MLGKLLVVLSAACITPWVQAGKLNDTTELRCLASDGTTLTMQCEGSGQDADYGRDTTQATPSDGIAGLSFQKVCNNGERAGDAHCSVDAVLGLNPSDWACTYDRVTGLTWDVKTGGWTPRDQLYAFDNWQVAHLLNTTNAESLCGYSDWALPTISQLQGLITYGRGNGSALLFDAQWFPNEGAAWGVWSGSGGKNFRDSRWLVEAKTGQVYYVLSDTLATVHLVRSDKKAVPKNRFISSGNEVYDVVSNLTWTLCPYGLSGSQCEIGFPVSGGIASGTASAKSYSEQTGKAWRLPNVKELQSLTDTTYRNPPLNPIFPWIERMLRLLSSTPYVVSGKYEGHPWMLVPEEGGVSPSGMTGYFLFVRDGK